jgi:RNA polymerase sigma-70 factor (ECF subfamily)
MLCRESRRFVTTFDRGRPSFEALFHELRLPVLKLCFRILGDRCAAEDAVQQTFCLVHEALPGFRGDAAPATWVYRIALRATLTLNRSRVAFPLASTNDEPNAAQVLPDAQAMARQELRRVIAAMASLPFEQRTVLSMAAIEGISHRTIADVLNVPLGTVASRLHVARRALRAALQEPAAALNIGRRIQRPPDD